MTIEEIAAQFSLSELSIRRRMRDLGIRACPRGPYVDREREYQWSEDLLETARTCLRVTVSIGLMTAKSLRLGPLAVPDEYFADFLRGCIDGDGSIVTYTDRYNTFKSEKYVYERLFVSLVSASQPFVEWIRATVDRLIDVQGALHWRKDRLGYAPIWQLKYMKNDSIRLLKWMYYSPGVPCLARKRDVAMPFLSESD